MSRATASTAAESAARASALVAASAAPAAPDASRNTVSLVLVSPSTDSWFHVRAAAERRSVRSVAGSAVASVRRTESIVAMRGWIIPTPLQMPETVTVTGAPPSAAGRATRTEAIFVVESVVRSDTAASASASSVAASPPAATRAIAAVTLSTGRRVPMTPVERWSTCSGVAPMAAATARPMAAWSASPPGPVAALALPEVAMTARA